MNPFDSRSTDPLWVLLDRYAAGECTPAEQERVRQLLAGSGEAQANLDTVVQVRHAEATRGAQWDVERMWQAAEPLIQGSESTAIVRSDPEPRATVRKQGPMNSTVRGWLPGRVWTGAFATLALLVVAFLGHIIPRRSSSAQPEMTYRTRPGQRMTIALVDGSKMVLAPGTVARVSMPLIVGSARTVTLTGEAIFDVAQDPARPFVVEAGNSITRVLGTRFSVRRYADDAVVRVAVASGRVALNTVLLEAGDVGQLTSTGSASVTRDQTVDALFAWQAGRLVFRDATIAEVAAQITRWYDRPVVVANPLLAERRVNALIDADPGLPAEAATVGAMLGVRIEREGRLLKLVPLSNP